MNINISGEVVRTSQLPKRIIGLGDYLIALNSSPLETSTVLVSDFVSFLNTQFATSLASLTDVSINGPLPGQALVFNGSYWVNQGIGELDTLDSVTTRGNTTLNSITTGGLYSPYLRLDTVATPTLQAGMFAWNDVDGTANLRLKGNNVTLQVGQETVARVVNKTGADLLESEYKVVRVRVASEGGAQGQRLAVVLAQGDNDPDSATTLGVVTENIGNNQEGFITIFGNVNGINTTGSLQGETWVDGDVLYLSPTTPGALTKVKPVAPQHTLIVGYVVYAHQNNGKIFVKVDNGYELDELHNVLISNPNNNDILQYNSTQQVWKNIAASVAVPTPTLAQVTTAGNTTTNAINTGLITSTTAAVGNMFAVNGANSSSLVMSNDSFGRVNVTVTGNAVGGVAGGAYFSATGYQETWFNVTSLQASAGNKVWRFGNLGQNNYFAIQKLNDAGTAITLTALAIASSTGNVLINTTTDAGYKLDVLGTTRVVGTDIPGVLTVGWGKSNTITLGSNTANSPQIYLGSLSLTAHPGGSSLSIDPGFITTTNQGSNTNRPITIAPTVTGTSTGNVILLSSGARLTANRHVPTSGVLNMVMVGGATPIQYMDFAPSSGNAEFNSISIVQQINTSGTYAGIVRGIYYNPILTSTTGVIHRAIETTSGDVIFNGGNVGIGTTGLVPGYLLTINGGVSIAAGQSLSLDPSFGIYMVASSSQFRLYNNSIAALSVASTGNVLINTVTDAGYKLNVSGTFRTLVGTETNPFRLEHTNGNYMTMVVGAGSALAAGQFGMYFNGSPMWSWNGAVFRLHGNTISTASNPSTLILQGGYGGSTVGTSIRLSSNTPNQGQWTATTGAQVTVEVGNHSNETWSPSSGNASYTLLSIAPRINTTGTYAGIVTGFAYNPTLTSVTGVTHRAIHTVTGDVLLGTTSGNVGVGTTSPFGKLDVKDGEIYVTTSTNANLRSRLTYQGLSVSRASDGGYPEQIISTDSAWQYHSRNRHTLYIDTIPHLQIGHVGISGLNIPQSNNIIIGNSADNGYKLQVKGNAYLAGSAGTTTLNVDFGNVNSNVKILSHGSSDFTQIQIGTNFSLSRNGGGDPSIGTTFGLGIISSSLSLQTSTASPGKLWLKGNYGLGSAYFGANNSNGVTASTLYFQNSETPTAAQNVLATFNLWGISDNATAPTIPASSMFSLHSTTRGFLPPRLTTAEILAISSPSEGLQVYNTDLKTICFYNGTAWQRVTSTAM